MKIIRWILPACLLLLVVPSAPGRAAPDPEPQPSQITFTEWDHPRSLDPHRAGDVVASRHVGHVYETLLEYAPFGPMRLQPCLAKEMPAYDDDALTYTFKLRDDVFFADDECFPEGHGRKLTAQDVVFSIKRLAALPDSAGFWVLDGYVAGLDAFREKALGLVRTIEHKDGTREAVYTPEWWKHMDEDVSGVKALDDTTVQFTLTQRYPQFLYAITLSYGAAVAPEAARKYDLSTHMVGTGPYMLKESSDDLLVYERNPNYRALRLTEVPDGEPLRSAEGSRLPLTDVLRYEIVPDSAEAFDLFMQGVTPITGLDNQQFAQVIDEKAHKAGKHGDEQLREEYRKQGIHLREYTEPTLHYISFNMNDKTFGTPAGKKGRALRAAFALCIDRNEYIDNYLNGRGVAAQQLVPEGIPGRSDDCAMEGQRFDPAAARDLLKDAGFTVSEKGGAYTTTGADGKQVELEVCFRSVSESTEAFGKWLTEAAATIGIKLKPAYMTFGQFLGRQDEGKGQAYDAGWVMDYPDAQNMMQLLYGPNKPPGINSASYASPQYDKLYEELANLHDDVPKQLERKRKLLVEMHKQLAEDTPWVLFEFRVVYMLYHDGVHMPPPNPFSYTNRKYFGRKH